MGAGPGRPLFLLCCGALWLLPVSSGGHSEGCPAAKGLPEHTAKGWVLPPTPSPSKGSLPVEHRSQHYGMSFAENFKKLLSLGREKGGRAQICPLPDPGFGGSKGFQHQVLLDSGPSLRKGFWSSGLGPDRSCGSMQRKQLRVTPGTCERYIYGLTLASSLTRNRVGPV